MLDIKVVGPGCVNCEKLASLCETVVNENNLEANIEKVTDINEFGNLGIMITPGLVVNSKVLSQGKIPTKTTLVHWLKNNIN